MTFKLPPKNIHKWGEISDRVSNKKSAVSSSNVGNFSYTVDNDDALESHICDQPLLR